MTSIAASAMPIAEDVAAIRELSGRLRDGGASMALVPTMGALHDGHLRLVDRAREIADSVIVSIFVNPLQFGPGEDLDRYPRQLAKDIELLERRGVQGVFAPPARVVYPDGEPSVTVRPEKGADRLCGRSRPEHFAGVLTVVAKLFNLVQPTVAVFGRKDFQQTVLIRRMVEDLNMPVEIEVVPTVRDADGLALSSRNEYLTSEERERARTLPDTLFVAQERFARGERSVGRLVREAAERLRSADMEIDYLEIVEPRTLDPVGAEAPEGSVYAAAVRLGRTRLIDNVRLGDSPGRV